MKKIKLLLVLCIFAIITTGCVKYNATMDIKKDKSMDFTIIYALDKSFASMGSLKREDFSEVEKNGYTITEYSDDSYVGFKITKSIKNIDEVSTESDVAFSLSGMMDGTGNNPYMFKVVKGEDKNTYTAKFTFDSNDSNLNSGNDEDDYAVEESLGDETDNVDDDSDNLTGNNNFDMSKLTSNMDLSFSVNLPNSALNSNATSKENGGKKLTWKLATTGTQNIEFSFDIDNNASSSNTLLWVGIGAGVLLLVVIAVVIVVTSKKKNANVAPTVNEQPKEETKE